MYQRESFYRGDALGSESRLLPASTYNEMRLLFQRCGESCLFVPVRSLQYMAVIDEEEVIFVDSQRKAFVEFSWRHFNPHSRNSLEDPVPYEFVYYDNKALETMVRAQGEFAKFIHQMSDRKQVQELRQNQGEKIIPFRGVRHDK